MCKSSSSSSRIYGVRGVGDGDDEDDDASACGSLLRTGYPIFGEYVEKAEELNRKRWMPFLMHLQFEL